jgi:hypothetical protein
MAAISVIIPGSWCTAHRSRRFPGNPNDGLDRHLTGPGYVHPVRLVFIIPSSRCCVHISGFDPGTEKMGRLVHFGCTHFLDRSSDMPSSLCSTQNVMTFPSKPYDGRRMQSGCLQRLL